MSDDMRPIEPPNSFPARTLTRAATEGVIELIPGAGLLTNILAVTHPPVEEVDRRRWENDISRRSNEQDELLKSVVAAFLRLHSNNQYAANAQHLSFIRGGMVSTLEGIGREGLTPVLQAELSQKLEETAKDVEDLLEGLDVALMNMSDDEKSKEFMDVLHDVVFGAFGKSNIRNDIDRLMRSSRWSIEEQKRIAFSICDSIDRFNAGLTRLSSYATASVKL